MNGDRVAGKRSLLGLLFALVLPGIAPGVTMTGSAVLAWTEPAAPAPRVVRESRFDIADPPSIAEVVQQVVDFSPGAWTSPHSHGGQAINLVMQGEITFRQGNSERTYPEGQAWSDPTGTVHAAGNSTGAQAQLLTNFLLPEGARQTTVQGESRLQPSVTYEARFPAATLPAQVDVVQQATDFEPGAWTPSRRHGGQAVHIVVFGEVTHRASGNERVYSAGEAWSDEAGRVYSAGNKGTGKARLFTTILLPDGAELTETATEAAIGQEVVEVPKEDGLATPVPVRVPVGVGVLIAAAGLLALAGLGFLVLRRGRTG